MWCTHFLKHVEGSYHGCSGSCNLVKSKPQLIVTKSYKDVFILNCLVKTNYHLTLTQELWLLCRFVLKVKVYWQKEFYGDFEKSLKPLENGVRSKWKVYHWNQHVRKPDTGKLQSPSLNNKENRFLASVALICFPFLCFVFFFFSAGLAGYQNIIERCLMAHSKAISYIYVLFINSCHLQVSNGTKMALTQGVCAISQGVAVVGYQNIVDRFL